MRLADVSAVSEAVSATRSRLAKAESIASLLENADAMEIPIIVGFLSGVPRQGKVGIGWAAVSGIETGTSDGSGIDVTEVDDFLEGYSSMSGPGSQQRRGDALDVLLTDATLDEVDFLRRLVTGQLRQGALEGVMIDAIARAFDVPVGSVRRAAMLSGDLGSTAAIAASEGEAGLTAVGLEVLTPVQPMLAASAPDVGAAVDQIGEAIVEWKLDGTRIQAHRRGADIRIYTRNLNDVTDRIPSIVRAVSRLPVGSVILDGESMAIAGDGGPMPFEQTMSEFGSGSSGRLELQPFWFDVLHLDGKDLIDLPLTERRALLESFVGSSEIIPQIRTSDVGEAKEFLAAARALRHEGVMVKDPVSPYEAGRRGSAWIKVKPVYTLDLVILAVEWGSGRRTGWLSNIHLGARDPDGGGFVMLGKTFKGLTDEMLEYQTKALLALEERRTKRVVYVRPELVVEVAFDGLLPSTRYPGGMALRFARVRSHRPDKDASQADTIDTVREIFESRRHRAG